MRYNVHSNLRAREQRGWGDDGLGSVLPLEEDGDDAEAADAAGEEAEEDVGRGDEPEGEQVDHGVAVVLGARQLGVRPVDPDNSGQ